MSHSYDTVFFDWGGVVADDPGDEFLGELLRKLGASETELREIYRIYMQPFMKGHITESKFWNDLRRQYGYSIPDTISQEFLKWTGLKANTGILELVESLKQEGLQTAIFSNVIEPTYKVLHISGYYNQFDKVVASCKVGYAKPEKQIYTLALQMLNTTGEKSIFIDDKERNLIPARELGFTTILAQSPEQIISVLHKFLSE